MTDRNIPHEDAVRAVVADEAQKDRAAKTNLSVASPTADVNSLKTAVDALRTALLTAGLIK